MTNSAVVCSACGETKGESEFVTYGQTVAPTRCLRRVCGKCALPAGIGMVRLLEQRVIELEKFVNRLHEAATSHWARDESLSNVLEVIEKAIPFGEKERV